VSIGQLTYTEHGTAHLFGKLPATLDDTDVPADRVVVINDTVSIRASLAGAAKSVNFVGGAAGRSHMLLLGSDGQVYGFGNNIVGQLGMVRICVSAYLRFHCFGKSSEPRTR
jgi:alpha-tubulin suppressor-like RCC1 family protein